MQQEGAGLSLRPEDVVQKIKRTRSVWTGQDARDTSKQVMTPALHILFDIRQIHTEVNKKKSIWKDS